MCGLYIICPRGHQPEKHLSAGAFQVKFFLSSLHLRLRIPNSYSILGIIMVGTKWRFWPKSAIIFPVNNFPRHNKTRRLSFLGFWVWVMTFYTLLLICSINIFNYLFEQYMPNYTNCGTISSIFEKK